MEDDSRVRKCSSCKLVLPSHLFKSDTSNYYYKTCLPCRYKKRLKYYCSFYLNILTLATLSNVPLSKREKSNSVLPEIQQSQKMPASDSVPSNGFTPLSENDLAFQMQIASVIPQAKWVACENVSSDHCFIASAVLTPLSLDHYVGTSRKYSVPY